MYGKYLSILAYYEKFNDKYYVLTFEYGSINPINGTFLEESNREKIETTEFIWFHHFDVAIGRIFINNNIYTLTEAYQNKLISYSDIVKYHEYFRGEHYMKNYYSPYVYKFINSFNRGVKYEKNKLLVLLCLLSLTSCNTQSNIKEYDNNTYDEDKVLLKDFTLNNARDCVRGIRAYRYNSNRFAIDIFYYLEKTITEVSFHSYVEGYVVMAREFDPLDRMHEYLDLAQNENEKINGIIYSWNKKDIDDRPLIPIFVTYETVYTLTEAYNLNYINDDNLSNIKDLYNNHLDECKVNIRFFSYNTF